MLTGIGGGIPPMPSWAGSLEPRNISDLELFRTVRYRAGQLAVPLDVGPEARRLAGGSPLERRATNAETVDKARLLPLMKALHESRRSTIYCQPDIPLRPLRSVELPGGP